MTNHKPASAHTLALFPLSEVDRANRLLVDYLLNIPNATDLFAHSPEEMLELAPQVRAQADRTRLAQALVAFQRDIGADDAGIAAAQLLADPATPVVTAGQQPGLLTGPLYTIYKAMATINVARRLADRLGRPVVPVFWVGSDDDNRGEADHCGFWDQQYAIHTLHYPDTAGAEGQLIGDLPVECYGEQVLAQVEPLITGLPYAEETRALLHETLAASVDLGEWFCRLMARLFSPLGLVLCDSRLPEVRRQAGEVLRRDIAYPLQTTSSLNARAQEIQQRGYRPQLTKSADACNFFLLDGVRRRVIYRDGRFLIAEQQYTQDELLDWLAREPERWAPNAVLRPVVQEYLFGSALFISGPNEFGYWAELHPVFADLQVEMPPVLPRGAMTVIPPSIARLLHQWQLNPLELLYEYDQIRLNQLASRQPEPIERGFAETRAQLEQLMAHLSLIVSRLDETLGPSALASHQRMLNELERLERKTLKAVERQSTEQTLRLERVRKTLYPWRGLQERTLNYFCLYARFGPELTEQLRTLLDGEEGRHLFVEL